MTSLPDMIDWNKFTKDSIWRLSLYEPIRDSADSRKMLRRIAREYRNKNGETDLLIWLQSVERNIYKHYPEELKAIKAERKQAYGKGGYDPAAKLAYQAEVLTTYNTFVETLVASYAFAQTDAGVSTLNAESSVFVPKCC